MMDAQMKFKLKCKQVVEGEATVAEHKFVRDDGVTWFSLLPDFERFLEECTYVIRSDNINWQIVARNTKTGEIVGPDGRALPEYKKKPLITDAHIDTLRKIRALYDKQQIYTDKLPREFYDLIVDNEYINNSQLMVDRLADAYFGELADDVCWFIYEWKPHDDDRPDITIEGREYGIKTEEDYYAYLKEEYGNV